jgi:hypothetical protein
VGDDVGDDVGDGVGDDVGDDVGDADDDADEDDDADANESEDEADAEAANMLLVELETVLHGLLSMISQSDRCIKRHVRLNGQSSTRLPHGRHVR